MEEVIVRLAHWGGRFKGVTIIDGNGDYNVYINPHLNRAAQRRALMHELQHIQSNHFYDDCRSVLDVEEEAER